MSNLSLLQTIGLNKKQQEAFNYILSGNNIFITGNSGTGKTSIIKLFIKLYENSKNIGITSTTGCSSILFGGNTLHSFLGIGLGKDSVKKLYSKLSSNPFYLSRWTKLDILIIDEISMLSPILWDKLEELARLLRNNSLPFGGIQLVISGDFLQLPCVDSLNFCFEAKSWNSCIQTTVYLTDIMRQSDKLFQTCLNNIRIGNLDSDTKSLLNSRIGKKIDINGIIPTKLFSTNEMVDKINNQELDKLSELGYDFYEYSSITKSFDSKLSDSIISYYTSSCPASSTLQLCLNSQVMLIKNINTDYKLVNGSKGIITGFSSDNLPIVKFVNGIEIVIDYVDWDFFSSSNPNKKTFRISQIPLRLAFASTIHKTQGMTLDSIEIDLSNIFEYGQTYVGLSRVKSLDSISIININYDNIKPHPIALQYYENLQKKNSI